MTNNFSLGDFDLLLFDLDGTLVDSAPDIAAAVDATLVNSGWPAAGVERVRSWVGNGSRTLVERALRFAVGKFDTALHESVHNHFLLEYAKHNGPDTRVFPGVYECLAQCQAQNKKMACVTNKPEHLARQLVAHLGMEKYFALTIGGDTFPQRKPDPTALRFCCEKLDVPVSRTLMVGDSHIDVDSARAAGMKVLCVSYGYNHGGPVAAANPDWLVDDLRELIGK
ncbi:MAG TPA: phosphoglycolate phosphatase [Pseudomonadales bacterium]|nr:phosphoglycolate phosphatase [Pseudomonadales bacterium]